MRHLAMPSPAPVINANLYADDALVDSRELFQRIRDAGPCGVALRATGCTPSGGLKRCARPSATTRPFLSGRGVAANPIANALGETPQLSSDGETHVRGARS